MKNTGKHYLNIIYKWGWLILLLPLLSGAIAYMSLRDQPNQYQAEAQIMVGPGVDSPDPDYNTLRASEHLLETYKEIASTDSFSQSVIKDLNLGEMLPSTLQGMLEVRTDPNSLTLTIISTAGTPKMAADIANSVAGNLYRLSPAYPGNPAAVSREQNKVQVTQLESTIQETEARISTLEQEMQQLNQQDPAENSAINQALTSAENRVNALELQFQTASSVADQEKQGNAILQELTQNTNNRIQQLEANLTLTSSDTRNLVLDKISAEKDHLSNLQKAILDNQQTIEGMPLSAYIDKTSANITNLQGNLSRYYDTADKRLITDQIDSERARLVNAGNIAAARQQEVLTQLADERKRLSGLRILPVAQNDYLAQQITEERNRLASLQETHAGLIETLFKPWTNQVKITQPATVPTSVPSSLRLSMLIAAIAGGALALAIVMIAGYFDDSFENLYDLEQSTGVPALGTLRKQNPFLERRSAPGEQLVVLSRPFSAAAGDYRLLAARLSSKLRLIGKNYPLNKNADRQLPGSVLMICGLDSDGITGQVSSNLGILLAEMDQKVLLVDANLKRPWIAKAFGIPEDQSEGRALSGIEGEIAPVELPEYKNLLIFPCCPASGNPYGFYASPKFLEVLEDWKRIASLVVIAAPPLMSGAEAFILAAHADGILLVIPEEKTRRKQVEEFVRNRATYSWKILGMVSVLRGRNQAGEEHWRTQTTAARISPSVEKEMQYEPVREANGVNGKQKNGS